MRLPKGISDFKELIQGTYLFADKSQFIKDVIKVVLIRRPRHFGKTLSRTEVITLKSRGTYDNSIDR